MEIFMLLTLIVMLFLCKKLDRELSKDKKKFKQNE